MNTKLSFIYTSIGLLIYANLSAILYWNKVITLDQVSKGELPGDPSMWQDLLHDPYKTLWMFRNLR